jgi:DNA-binding transcriptional ArsR family regulator
VDKDLRQWVLCLSGVRLEILLRLSARPARVGDLAASLDLGYTNISHALRQLRRLKCVTSERSGPSRIYRLSHSVAVDHTGDGLSVRLTMPGRRHVMLLLPE